MHTLVDFITYVKGVEYVLSLIAIAAFLVYWEFLKPRPFRHVVETGKDDLKYLEGTGGLRHVVRSVGRVVAAPFIGLAYIVMLPVGFFAMLAITLVNLAVKAVAGIVGKSVTFEWRPMEAYLTGRKKKEKLAAKQEKDNDKDQ